MSALPAGANIGAADCHVLLLKADTSRDHNRLCYFSRSSSVLACFKPNVLKASVKHRSEKLSGLIPLPPIASEPCHAHSRAELPEFRLLCTGDGEGALETGFRPLWRHQGDFAADAMVLGPFFFGCFGRRDRFTKVASGLIELKPSWASPPARFCFVSASQPYCGSVRSLLAAPV